MFHRYLIPSLILPLGCAATLVAEEIAAQDPCCPPKPCCVPVCCPEIVEDCCAFNKCPPTTQVTPNAGPRVNNGADLFITADFTWWTAHEDGLVFTMIEEDAVIGQQVPETTVPVPDFKWKPGFKVGAGYNFCHDGWDVYLEYTWFRSSDNKRSISVDPDGPDLSDTFWRINDPFMSDTFPLVRFDHYEAGSIKWGVQLNVFDLELGRNFYISRRLMLRPHFGLKGMWGDQTLKVRLDEIGPPDVIRFISSMDNKVNNWGIGIRAGIDTAWHFSESFSVLGEFALTGLWEQFKGHRKDETTVLSSDPITEMLVGPVGTVTSSVNHSQNFYALRPILEWFLGLRWEMWTCGDSFHFAIDAGWEQQLWFDQNQFLKVRTVDADRGDLSLQGLTVRTRFDF